MQLKRRLPLWLVFFAGLVACCFFLTGPGYAKTLVDLNTASAHQLDTLKGIGPATAKKIMANRPYTSVDDLAKAGLSAKEIETLKPMVTVSSGQNRGRRRPRKRRQGLRQSGQLVDLNTASQGRAGETAGYRENFSRQNYRRSPL